MMPFDPAPRTAPPASIRPMEAAPFTEPSMLDDEAIPDDGEADTE
ncbi:hypothetical protein MTDSW087_05827 [Methylobacterium dankookense]|uniref:Uncharacterized protein n=1 Tax=Methylobacterium dankookense TaxID=560405 RepID=A0A564G7S8_9HYPH|nr:hypothetical protein IFDJLNFL_5712 [Methylobacterium dankookense]VUF16076.1 hypothetical protein MTDSW087_05827 [Methylobacterium dankookense]